MRTTLLLAAWLALTAMSQAGDTGPYLAPDLVPDGVAILPPPPAPGSAAARADRAIFVATRRLQGTPRWRIATEDVGNAPLDRYACALGMRLTPASAPALTRLLDRAGTGDLVNRVKQHYRVPRPYLGTDAPICAPLDRYACALGMRLTPASAPALTRLLDRAGTGDLVNRVKQHYRVPRPYLGTDAPICEPRTAHLAGNGDYPSGHTANGWLEGLILAELVPERATAILARARAYGESRAVCGSHSASAVQAGWMAGSAMFAILGGTPGFQRDLKAAREELVSISSSAPAPDPGQCKMEQGVLAARPW